LGDPAPLEVLSFRDVSKPLGAENGGLWIQKKTFNIFDNIIKFARFDGPLIFWFLVNLSARGVFKNWKYLHKIEIVWEVFH